jgi:hypothetical protein
MHSASSKQEAPRLDRGVRSPGTTLAPLSICSDEIGSGRGVEANEGARWGWGISPTIQLILPKSGGYPGKEQIDRGVSLLVYYHLESEKNEETILSSTDE